MNDWFDHLLLCVSVTWDFSYTHEAIHFSYTHLILIYSFVFCNGTIHNFQCGQSFYFVSQSSCFFSPVLSYFAQILEEHGPLELSDPLLVGELKNFPLEAQQKIEAAGGLEHFLLESPRFLMCDGTVGLMSHSVCLQHTIDNPSSFSCMDDLEPKGSSQLNPTAKEFLPQFKHLSLNNSSESFDQAVLKTALPSPYGFDHPNLNDSFGQQGWTVKEAKFHVFPNIPLNAFKPEALSFDNNYNNFKEDMGPTIRTIFVQVKVFFVKKNHLVVFTLFLFNGK